MTVILAPSARNDLAWIYEYYAERNYEHMERVVRAILLACEGITQFPLMGKQGSLEGTRERLMSRYPYRLVYRITDDDIIILRVMHTRQQWP